MLVLPLCGCSIGGGDASAKKPRRPYAVLVVFDEFPSDTLLAPGGRIDAGRFPNFAALAGDSTWFRNAAASYDSTTKAVPLILDGIRPHKGTLPTVRDHPHSIFTALGRRGYRIVTAEEATALCPRRYCPAERTRRPAIIPNLKGGRAERFGRFVGSIRPSRRPDVLDEARAAAARAVGLPAVGPSLTPRGAGAPARNADGARLLRRLPDPPQRAALPAPARVRGPPARQAGGTAEEPGDVRRHAHRGDRRPRLRMAGGRADPAHHQPLERGRAGSGAAVREEAATEAWPRERRAGAHPRRDAHDRRRARRAGSVTAPTAAPRSHGPSAPAAR